MDTNDNTPTPADENVERLIEEAYRPEPIDLRFAERTLQKLQELADERKEARLPWRQLTWLYFANAAAVLLLIAAPPLFWRVFMQQPRHDLVNKEKEKSSPGDRLTPRPRKIAEVPPRLEVGQTVATEAGKKRKVRLPDDTLVSLNHDTVIRLDEVRQLTLLGGEVFIEVEPARKKTPFVIRTTSREMTALGTKLAIRDDQRGTSVLVTQGQVKVSDVEDMVGAGQVVEANATKAVSAERNSLALEWTGELLDDTRLVPNSDFRGGALTAKGLDGEPLRLHISKYHVDVHLEDGFARTTIDQSFFNHTHGRLEGIYQFPLPADASLSRLAMYVEGTRMEGGMVEREQGRAVYESIVRSMKDPALLEWVDGTTFKMRIFPLEPRQEKRIILSYTQKLPGVHGRTTYRFPVDLDYTKVGEWSFHARIKNGEKLSWKCASHALQSHIEKGDLLLKGSSNEEPPPSMNVGHLFSLDHDLVLELKDPDFTGGEQAHFAITEFEGERFLMLRYRPEWPVVSGKRTRRDWVILFEASGDRDPLLARTQIEVVRALLRNIESDDRFTILSVNTRTRWLDAKPQAATKENVEKALAALEQVHLLGGLDLASALTEAATKLRTMDNPHLVHVGSGCARLGERRHNKLIEMLPDKTRYVGVGVGKRWDRAFFKTAAEKTSGMFVHINPDEPIAWRTFDMLATLNTPRLLNMRIAEKDTPRFLTDTTQLFQGEEWCVAARLHKDTPLPQKIVVEGTLDGKAFHREIAVKNVATKADYIPRIWARWQIDELVAEGAKANKDGIVTLSKRMYVMSPFTSLLVLENDAMYERFKVDRGRKDHWAMYDCPDKIPVLFFPLNGSPHEIKAEPIGQVTPEKLSVLQVRRTILTRQLSGVVHRDLGSLIYDKRSFGDYVPLASNPSLRRHGLVRDFYGESDERLLFGSDFQPSKNEERVSRIKADVDLKLYFKRFGDGNRDALVDGILPFDSTNTPQSNLSGPRSGMIDNELDHPGNSGEQIGEERVLVQEQSRMQEKIVGYRDLGLARTVFRDLTLHALGFHTSRADVLSVLEAEANQGQPLVKGSIDPKARVLIDKARELGWRRIEVSESTWQEAYSLAFDGKGRYRCERTVALGLKEIVVCDGKTILNLYPEIGLGTKRPVTRFHRADFSTRVPEAIPPIEDLAVEADVMAIGETTVAIVPHQGKVLTELEFTKEGRLLEKRLVEKSSKKILRSVKLVERTSLVAPDLAPDLRSLVVLPMPLRTKQHVDSHNPEIAKKSLKELNDEEATAVLASRFVEESNSLEDFIKVRFLARGDKRIGLLTLLTASCEYRAGTIDGKSFDGPLAKYLDRFNRREAKMGEKESEKTSPLTFVERMTELLERLDYLSENILVSENHLEQHLKLLRTCRSPLLLWALGKEYVAKFDDREDRHKSRVEMILSVLDVVSQLLRDVPEVGYSMRYDYARGLHRFGRTALAKTEFRDLYKSSLEKGQIPFTDATMRDALGNEDWRYLLRNAAEHSIKAKKTRSVLVLAEQAQQIGDEKLADELIDRAIMASDESKRSFMEAIALLCHAKRLDSAETLATRMVSKKAMADDPASWRLAAKVAILHQGRTAKTMALLERALELQWRHRSSDLRLAEVRIDYDMLLSHYQRLVQASSELEQSPSPDLAGKVLRAVERWRILDPQGDALQRGVDVLIALGERDTAWDYLTTLMAREEVSASSWQDRASQFRKSHEFELAERCLKEAQAMEPERTSLVLDHAKLLMEAGKREEARTLLRLLTRDKWASKFDEVRMEARQMLGER